jgi:predicted NUDIX family phosphoesterase
MSTAPTVNRSVLALPSSIVRRMLGGPVYVPSQEMLLNRLAYHPELIRQLPETERARWEPDDALKQLVVYVLVRRGDDWLSYRRVKGEHRLAGKLSIGFGGHVEAGDEAGNGPAPTALFLTAALRELEEELEYEPRSLRPVPAGLVNHDSDLVGRCHLGLVYRLDLPPPTAVRARHPDLELAGWIASDVLTLAAASRDPSVEEFEPWSRVLLPYLDSIARLA